MATSPLSVEQFAAKIKAKYPDYASVPDDELARRIVEKYPEYKAQVSFQPIAAPVGELPGSTPRLRAAAGAPEPQPEQGFFGQAGTRLKEMGAGMAKDASISAAANVVSPVAGAAYTLAQILRGSHKEATEGASPLGAIPIIGPMAGQMGRDAGEGNYGGAAVNAAMLAPTAVGAARGATRGASGIQRLRKTSAINKQVAGQVAAEEAAIAAPKPVQDIANATIGATARNPRFEATIQDVIPELIPELGEGTLKAGVTVGRAKRALYNIANRNGQKFETLAAEDMAKPVPVEQFKPIIDFLDQEIANPIGAVTESQVKQLVKLRENFTQPHTVRSVNDIQKALNNKLAKMFHSSPNAAEAMASDPYWQAAREVRGLVADTVYRNLSDPRAQKAYQMSGKAREVATEFAQTEVLSRRSVKEGAMLPSPWEVGVGTTSPAFAAVRYGVRRMEQLRNKKVDHPDYILTKALQEWKPSGIPKPTGEIPEYHPPADALGKLRLDLQRMLRGAR